MRVLMWHGWLLEGAGSNVHTARVSEVLRSEGHDVLLLCQEGHPERYPWIDAWGRVGADRPRILGGTAGTGVEGRCILLRPDIGEVLPVFVYDDYEGFRVKTFVDLTDEELQTYLRRNVEALRAAAAWHGSDVVIAGHAVPGPVVARRALGPERYVARIHGSDLEFAVRPQERYRDLAHEGLRAARAVAGASDDVLARCAELVPGLEHLLRRIPPGVDVGRFHPMPRREALLETAARLEADPSTARGRPGSVDRDVERALARRDAAALADLAATYDQEVPDPDAAARLRELAESGEPLVGSFGKLIPEKGVDLLLGAARRSAQHPAVLVVGFGLYREWLAAVDIAVRGGDAEALVWLREAGGLSLEPTEGPSTPSAPGSSAPAVFTGRLDHRYAPGALAAMDVLVVPSVLVEAFGMVAAEGAAAGALPLVARHSGLAEIAAGLEGEVGRPGLFSFEPGPRATQGIAEGIDRLLSLPAAERDQLRRRLSAFVAREWSWQRTASRFLEVAGTDT